MIPVIISGGSGTRLWPVSRSAFPKQFCNLFGDSLQNLTFKRLSEFGEPWILTGQTLRVQTEIGLKELAALKTQVIYEPMARNTAPAVGVLTYLLIQKGFSNEVAGVFPSDHLITDQIEFRRAVRVAEKTAMNKKIVTLGIQAGYTETGYGYIQVKGDNSEAHPVMRFHEKPQIEKAKEFVASKEYFWNAGIFIFHVQTMADMFAEHQPRMWKKIQEIKPDLTNLEQVYAEIEAISIDYAIMEKIGGSGILMCVPTNPGWSDVGSWDAVAEENLKSHTVPSRAQVLEENSKNNFVMTSSEKVVALVGVEDLNIVDTGDVLMVLKKGHSQQVKKIVDQLTVQKSSTVKDPITEKRPWGSFEILRDTDDFKSKVIEVLPHSQLSYQSHGKRAEHWIIVKGNGEVVLNDEIVPIRAGSHVFIPMGAKHRIRNTSNEVIQFVEVQLGTYFGEDDIVRYQDDYKRS